MHLWTAKEAYLKARGLGVTEALHEVEVIFAQNEESSRLLLGSSFKDIGERWQLESWLPTGDHIATTCAERDDAATPRRINRRWVRWSDDSASLVLAE